MSSTERDEIAPPLAVFTSLFRYLLVTIHDTEFYDSSSSTVGGEIRKQQQNWMPFTLSELVPMSLALRDVALGRYRPAHCDDIPESHIGRVVDLDPDLTGSKFFLHFRIEP